MMISSRHPSPKPDDGDINDDDEEGEEEERDDEYDNTNKKKKKNTRMMMRYDDGDAKFHPRMFVRSRYRGER